MKPPLFEAIDEIEFFECPFNGNPNFTTFHDEAKCTTEDEFKMGLAYLCDMDKDGTPTNENNNNQEGYYTKL